jgi:hypothetical protein
LVSDVRCLPTLLAAAWLAIALTLSYPDRSWWWLLGVAAAPSIAVGAMRMAGRGPLDHTWVPLVMPMSGSWIPTGWLIWSLTGLDAAVTGCLPLLLCLFSQPGQPFAAIAAQTIASAAAAGVWGVHSPKKSRRRRSEFGGGVRSRGERLPERWPHDDRR